MEKVIYSQWLKRGTNTFIPTDNSKTVIQLEPGLYDLRSSREIGIYFFKKEIHLDELLKFPSSVHTVVLENVKHFWSREEKFKEYGFAFKRGILLHGKPGSGKSCTINLAVKHMVDDLNAVVISLKSQDDLELYSRSVTEILRIIEPTRPLMVIMEDIETFCEYSATESLLLNILDGIEQLENVIYIATTNYIEKLKERIINRPSRFDRRIYIPMPSVEDRRFYFEKKLKPHDLKNIDIDKWVEKTDNMSIAHLAELIKSVIILGNSFEEGIKLLEDLNDVKHLHSNNYEKDVNKSIGFKTETSNKKSYKSILWDKEVSSDELCDDDSDL